MISLETIENDIAELEKRDTCFATCERLAWLYIVRDHLQAYAAPPEPKAFSAAGPSAFLQAAMGKPEQDVWRIMDDLMSALALSNPRVHASVIRKLNAINDPVQDP